MKKAKIKKLIQVSADVIKDCSLENGAVVAANSDKSTYQSIVQDYRYVWIRDASYICISADLLGLKDIPERFFDWCLRRAEGFEKTGIFYNAYNVNETIHGTLVSPAEPKVPRKVRDRYGTLIHHATQYQPDQSGSLLIAIGHHIKHFGIRNISGYKVLIQKTASGICNLWKKGQFALPCFDLWEERCILPTQKRFHTYSLAICIAGLRVAIELLGKKNIWLQTEKEMSSVFSDMYSSESNLIPRTYTTGSEKLRAKTKKEDYLPDVSLLGLVYPSGVLEPLDKKMQNTVEKIIEKNSIDDGGLLRYPGDKYCGGIKNGQVRLTGAGTWPLLSFWMAIYFHLRGDTKNAGKYFYRPLERIDKYIPEQIFKDKKKTSICPLAWSHSMFVIAADFLGYL